MAWVVPMQVCEVKTLKLPKLKGRTMSSIVYKSGSYVSVPMSENLFWNRVGWLRHAMLTAENFEFRLLYFHKLQDLMKFVP
tara:strand:- start:1664 stop:1906 length:243 start_codon:yes stop_codon:yes gene_type:complete